MLTRILCHIVLFIHLANTGVTGLYLKPKCQVQAFSCPCDQSGGDGTEDLKKVSVTRCVTEGNLSKDVVCRSGDVVTKCHEMRGKLQTRDFFVFLRVLTSLHTTIFSPTFIVLKVVRKVESV